MKNLRNLAEHGINKRKSRDVVTRVLLEMANLIHDKCKSLDLNIVTLKVCSILSISIGDIKNGLTFLK